LALLTLSLLSLHDALPIFALSESGGNRPRRCAGTDRCRQSALCGLLIDSKVTVSPTSGGPLDLPHFRNRHGGIHTAHDGAVPRGDRKSTRMNSSHVKISYY